MLRESPYAVLICSVFEISPNAFAVALLKRKRMRRRRGFHTAFEGKKSEGCKSKQVER
jgi:hypothetical protein